jgi:type I restriction enzyme S subunit
LCDELEEAQTTAREHRTRLVRSALDHLTTAKDESDFKKHSAFCIQHSELLFDSVPAFRQAIFSLAVQGHLVPQNPKDEPASVLLATVKTLIAKIGWEELSSDSEEQQHAMAFEVVLSSGWVLARIGEFAIVKGGKRLPAGAAFSPSPTPHIYIRVTAAQTTATHLLDATLHQILTA